MKKKKTEKKSAKKSVSKKSESLLDSIIKDKKSLGLFVILLIAVALVVVNELHIINNRSNDNTITPEEVSSRIDAFAEEHGLVPSGTKIKVSEVIEESGLYKAKVLVKDNEFESYMTKDGKVFFPDANQGLKIETEEEKAAKAEEAKKKAEEAEKKVLAAIKKEERPKAELFVMSFCPYGVQAENAMAPVADLLGDKADIEIRFIASIEGNDISKVNSLHGEVEGIEDVRQLCAIKNYGKETFWKYVMEINEKCYPDYRKEDTFKTCWQTAAKNAGMNVAALESCVRREGVALINNEEEISKAYKDAGVKVSGSPSFVVNGKRVDISRTPEGYKKAICAGFKEQPEECKTELPNVKSTTSSGGCG